MGERAVGKSTGKKLGKVVLAFFLLVTFVDVSASQNLVAHDAAIFEASNILEAAPNFNWYQLPKKPNPDDPVFPASRRETGGHQAMWEPLFILDYTAGELKGWLAESIEPNATMDEWTLKLRKNVKWSDGETFTSDDVVYTVSMVLREEKLAAYEAAEMRRALKPNTIDEGNKGGTDNIVINGVEKIDDLTVIFKLVEPDPRFALKNFGGGMFGSFLIMPEHKWPRWVEKNGRWEYSTPISEFLWDKPIGTGPYILGSYDTSKQQVIWNRNDGWWGKKSGFKADNPGPKQLIWQYVASEVESKKLLIAGELDAAREYTKPNFDDAKIQSKGSVRGWSTLSPTASGAGTAQLLPAAEPAVNEDIAWNEPCTRQLEVNTKVAPWNNVKARQALTYMIDRERLAAIGYEKTTVPSRTMFVEYGSMEPFIKAIEDAGKIFPAKPDTTKAKALLEDPSVGYKQGPDGIYRDKDNNVLTAVITVNQDIAKDQKATADLVAQLKEQGLDARLEPLPNGEFWGRSIPTGDYDLAYGWLSCGSLAEPYTSMARYRMDKVPAVGSHSPNFNNTGRWDSQANKDYAAKLDEIEPLKLADPAIPKLVVEAYAYIVDEVPFIPLVQTPRIIPFNTTHWTGWPSANEPEGGIPMHNWGATHQMIHALKKAP